MRWNRKFDVSKELLIDKSHKPLTTYPNFDTKTELKQIKNLIRRNPHIPMSKLYKKLRIDYGYSKHATSLSKTLKNPYYSNKTF